MEKINTSQGDIIYYLFNKHNQYNNTQFTANFDFFTPDIYRISNVLTGGIFLLQIVYMKKYSVMLY